VGICTALNPSDFAQEQIDFNSLNGALSPINCAKKIAGPFIVFIIFNYK
jgi:hypothetical protein